MRPRPPLLAACLALSCADEIPGVDPPGAELHFPVGITALPDASGQPAHLVVLSSNFDQRFNSGSLIAYSVEGLFSLASCPAEQQEDGICYADSLRPVQTDTVRIFSFGGDIVQVPTATGAGQLFVAARGRNRLTMINYDTSAAKELSCSTEGAEILPGSDCSPAFVVNTGFADPFALAHAPATATTPDLIGIGHVAIHEQNEVPFSGVGLANVEVFRQRVEIEAGLREGQLPEPVTITIFPDFGGVSGMVFAGNILGLENVFLAANIRNAPELLIAALTPTPAEEGLFRFSSQTTLRLTSDIGAIEMRALAIANDRTRAYASVRFFAPGAAFNAGIAVVDLTSARLEVLSVIELGEELQRPFLREVTTPTGETRRLLYVGDIRRDKIFVLDVTTGEPILVNEIEGRAMRTLEGERVQVRLLDGPSQLAFVTREDRTLGFVTNFGNSTLAVLDVSDPDPTQHRIIARLGRNIDAEGETEQP